MPANSLHLPLICIMPDFILAVGNVMTVGSRVKSSPEELELVKGSPEGLELVKGSPEGL